MANLAQCVKLLRASTDEQRFVGLLLAAKLMRTPADLALVFEEGMTFVRRLLLTPPSTGDGSEAPAAGPSFRGLALSVLASFSAEPALVVRPEFGACATAAAAPLLDGTTNESDLIDCAAVLGAVLRQPEGLTGPIHGRLLSNAVARAAAQPAPARAQTSGDVLSGGGGSAPLSASSLACELLVQTANHYAGAGGHSAGAAAAFSTVAELLEAARVLAPAVGATRDALSFERLASLRALLEAAAVQSERSRAAAPLPKAVDEAAAQAIMQATAHAEAQASAASAVLGVELRAALAGPLGSRLPNKARADVLRLAAVATELCGPAWVVGAVVGAFSSDGAFLSLLLQQCSVELQLCLHDQPCEQVTPTCLAVLPACCVVLEEALFRLHSDADDDDEGEDVAVDGSDGLRRGADGDVTMDGASSMGAVSGTGAVSGVDTCGEGRARRQCAPAVEAPTTAPAVEADRRTSDVWLAVLDDAQLLSAMQAFRRAIMAALEYLEALNTEQADARAAATAASAAAAGAAGAAGAAKVEAMEEDGGLSANGGAQLPNLELPNLERPHPLLNPVARFVSAWLAQPSSPEHLELYDRACHLLPLLHSVAAEEPSAAWAVHLSSFERRASSEPPDDDGDDQGGAEGEAAQETMAQLFERLIPKDARSRESWTRWAEQQTQAMGAAGSDARRAP